jgi:hypothetical protein
MFYKRLDHWTLYLLPVVSFFLKSNLSTTKGLIAFFKLTKTSAAVNAKIKNTCDLKMGIIIIC